MSWWEWIGLEVKCEFAAFARIHYAAVEELLDRATASGHEPSGLVLPWARRPDHARRAHAVVALNWYHRTKQPKTRVCSCGAEYQIPIKRGYVPRQCPECRERSAA